VHKAYLRASRPFVACSAGTTPERPGKSARTRGPKRGGRLVEAVAIERKATVTGRAAARVKMTKAAQCHKRQFLMEAGMPNLHDSSIVESITETPRPFRAPGIH